MEHRERVFTALNNEETDRCPMQISFTPEFASRLKKSLNISIKDKNKSHISNNEYILERHLDQDMLLTSVGWADSYYQNEDLEYYTDEWGVKWKVAEYETKFGTGHYTEIVGNPLSNDDAVSNYKSPNPNRSKLYDKTKNVIKNYKDEYFITGVTHTTIFESAWALRGLDKLMMDFALNPDLAEKILDIPYKYHLSVAKKLVSLGVDMIWLGDDVGAQDTMMISPEMWRKFLKPKMANFIAELKEINPNLKVAYHSDGNIFPIIPDLIEIGLDVLNPIQPASMDPKIVKEKYGDNLSFWGTIDEQHTLPFGSPNDVKKEVKTRLETVGKGGGLIIGPTHHVQLDTPLENFWAMVDTIKENKN